MNEFRANPNDVHIMEGPNTRTIITVDFGEPTSLQAIRFKLR